MNNPVLETNFKKIATQLGKNWKYKYHDSQLPHVDHYMDSEAISFNLNGEELLLSFHHSDPETLWIYAGLTQISFPVQHIHFSDQEPKVILEYFVEDWVNCIELSSDGTFRELHHLPKTGYRLALHQE
jgi:hypothetical protein